MKHSILYILIFLLSVPCLASNKEDNKEFIEIKSRYGFKIKRRQPLNFNVYLDFDTHTKKPEFFAAVSIQNDILQFRKTDNGYLARYRVSIAVRSDSVSLLQFSTVHEITFEDFKRTNSTKEVQAHTYRLNNSPEAFKLNAGDYTSLLEVQDLTTKKSIQRKLNLNLEQNFPDRHFNNICFLDRHPDSSASFPLAPYQKNLDYNKTYYAFTRIKTDSSYANQVQIKLSREKQLMLETKLTIPAENSVLSVLYALPTDSLSEGDYKLDISAGNIRQKISFSVVWFKKPTYLYELDLALRPMRYLLSEQEFDSAKDMSSVQLATWFKSFWKDRDPSPQTLYNELLFEYYQRVNESNFKFRSRSKEGWETDRGKIFILFGPPKSIENGRYASHSLPYIIWQYADSLKFIFVDKKRNGEFNLTETVQKD